MKTDKKISLFVWNFNKAIENNRRSFLTQDFLGIEKLLTEIYKEGWISGFKKHAKNDVFEIYLKRDLKGNVLSTKVTNTFKPSLRPIIRLTELASDKKNSDGSTGIIRTAKFGLLNVKNALKNKTGGIYLFKLY